MEFEQIYSAYFKPVYSYVWKSCKYLTGNKFCR